MPNWAKCVRAWWAGLGCPRARAQAFQFLDGQRQMALATLQHRHTHTHTHIHTMAARPMQAAGLPRFLLPRAPWSGLRAPAVAFQAGVEARRHGSVWPGSDRRRRRIAPSSHAALQTQAIRRPWRAAELPQWAGRGDSCDYAVGRQFQRGFRTTARQAKDHHFDTLKFVQRLKEEGFTEEQAEGMMRVLSDVIEERLVFFGGGGGYFCGWQACMDRAAGD